MLATRQHGEVATRRQGNTVQSTTATTTTTHLKCEIFKMDEKKRKGNTANWGSDQMRATRSVQIMKKCSDGHKKATADSKGCGWVQRGVQGYVLTLSTVTPLLNPVIRQSVSRVKFISMTSLAIFAMWSCSFVVVVVIVVVVFIFCK